MRIRTAVLAAVIGIVPSTASAVQIGHFPGVDRLIRESDAVVILRIDGHIDARSNRTLYTTHECFIYQTLKGKLPVGKRIRLRLMDTRSSFVTPYALSSTHLMFLTRKRTPNEPTEYRTIEFEGANVRLSPFGHESLPRGNALSEKVKLLVKGSMEYHNQQYEKEQEFLGALLNALD